MLSSAGCVHWAVLSAGMAFCAKNAARGDIMSATYVLAATGI